MHSPSQHLLLSLLLTGAAGALVSAEAQGAECRITVMDGYAGVNAAGSPSGLGLRARVDPFQSNGLLATVHRRGIEGVAVDFEALLPGVSGPIYIGQGLSNGDGLAELPLEAFYGLGAGGLTIFGESGGEAVEVALSESAHIQILASTPDAPGACDAGTVYPDVYGSLYFRFPGDDSPVLLSDIDDTLFNSADVSDILRAITLQHFSPIDSAAVPATQTFRASGGVLIGVTAQFNNLRPFTRSEMLFWAFDEAYQRETHNYQGAGFDGSYLPRSLTFIANDDYADPEPAYVRDHCTYKEARIRRLVDEVFGGGWENIMGIIGDSPDSDGCAAEALGLQWYFLREPGDDRPADTDGAHCVIERGWQEALPLLCADGGLDCPGVSSVPECRQ